MQYRVDMDHYIISFEGKVKSPVICNIHRIRKSEVIDEATRTAKSLFLLNASLSNANNLLHSNNIDHTCFQVRKARLMQVMDYDLLNKSLNCYTYTFHSTYIRKFETLFSPRSTHVIQ